MSEVKQPPKTFNADPPKYELRKVSELSNWDDNPRTITDQDFERLKQQVERLGVYKPLLINQNNIVIGGNMRLLVLEALGTQEVMCSIVRTDNTAQMLEYALSDNDQAGVTDEDRVAELATLNPIETELYAVNTKPLKPVQSILDKVSPSPQDNTFECPACGEVGGAAHFRKAV